MAREDSTVRSTFDAENRPYFSPEEAVGIVRAQGIMLEAASGATPSFASAAAGEEVPGNWWGHAKRYAIFDAIEAVGDSDEGAAEVLVCRLIGGKVTYVHRDLWPALFRLAGRFDPDRLALSDFRSPMARTKRLPVVARPTPRPARRSANANA